jgi:hypothetical protein
MLRDTIFGLEQRVHRRKLRQEVLDLCRDLSPAPEISFAGPVDGALHPSTRAQLLDTLREALGLIGHQAILSRIGISVDDSACVTVIETAAGTDGAGGPAPEHSELRDGIVRLGINIAIESVPGGTRLMWQLPVDSGQLA